MLEKAKQRNCIHLLMKFSIKSDKLDVLHHRNDLNFIYFGLLLLCGKQRNMNDLNKTNQTSFCIRIQFASFDCTLAFPFCEFFFCVRFVFQCFLYVTIKVVAYIVCTIHVSVTSTRAIENAPLPFINQISDKTLRRDNFDP